MNLPVALSLFLLHTGLFWSWPSRRNAIGLMQIGFSFVVHIIPSLLYASSKYAGDALYQRILVVGAAGHCVGLLIGRLARADASTIPMVGKLRSLQSQDLLARQCKRLACVGLAGMSLSLAYIGVIPALSGDPFQAKYFRGQYHERYVAVAPIYRTSFYLVVGVLPILFVLALQTRRIKRLLLPGAATVLLLLTLFRQDAASGLLLGAVVMLVWRTRTRLLLVSLIVLVYGAGSAAYVLLGLSSSRTDFVRGIAAGAPDIADQRAFITYFDGRGIDFTHGKTFWGGLVPYNYKWNPSVFSLQVVNPGVRIADIASGGFRMPSAVWGYAGFGLVGAFLIPMIHGFFLSSIAALYRRWERDARSPVESAFSGLTVVGLLLPIASFYTLSIYILPYVFVVKYLSRRLSSGKTGAPLSQSLRYQHGAGVSARRGC
jgi:hypothetical protein